MSIPQAVIDYCHANGYGAIRNVQSLGGGCINNASRLDTDRGPLFLKVNRSTPPDMFEREAEGLDALNAPGGPRVPKVLCVGRDFILQEFVEPGQGDHKGRPYWEMLGVQLATMHKTISPRFEFEHDNYIGSTPQVNTWEDDGYVFFAQHRLRYQAELAHRNNLLNITDYRSLITVSNRLPSLIPPQPASIIHGDLWSGNIHTGPSGEPVLIDPAAYYGWAEAELAMMTLFGSPPSSFFSAYESVHPLASGYTERFDLYNLYHLLNHLNLFGESYAGSVRAIIKRYANRFLNRP